MFSFGIHWDKNVCMCLLCLCCCWWWWWYWERVCWMKIEWDRLFEFVLLLFCSIRVCQSNGKMHERFTPSFTWHIQRCNPFQSAAHCLYSNSMDFFFGVVHICSAVNGGPHTHNAQLAFALQKKIKTVFLSYKCFLFEVKWHTLTHHMSFTNFEMDSNKMSTQAESLLFARIWSVLWFHLLCCVCVCVLVLVFALHDSASKNVRMCQAGCLWECVFMCDLDRVIYFLFQIPAIRIIILVSNTIQFEWVRIKSQRRTRSDFSEKEEKYSKM